MFMLSGHYRTQINFSMELLDSTKAALDRLYNSINNLENLLDEVKNEELRAKELEYKNELQKYKEKYIEKMDDDFNTADAISVIFDLIRDVNTNVTIESSKELVKYTLDLIRELGNPLGILQESTKASLEEEIEKLIEERQKARKEKKMGISRQN